MNQISAACYARVSSAQQADTQTVASQLAALRERASADGCVLPIEQIFVDEGYSGATLVRPALERLRDLIAAGGLARLYVHSPDRLARKYVHQVLLVDEFQRAGVEIVFLNRGLGQSPEDDLLLQVQGIVAEYERAKIMERSRRGKRHAASQGDVSVLTSAPYGYRYVRKQEGGGRAQVLIDFDEAAIVQQIFTWVGRDKLTIGAVRRRLLEAGIATRTGKRVWNHKTLWDMLANPAYKGEAAFGKTRSVPRGPRLRPPRGSSAQSRKLHSSTAAPTTEWITIPIPALVGAELFAAAQDQLHTNRRRARQQQHGARYLLQGLLVCAHCGYAYYGKTVSRSPRTNQENAYYRCSGSDSYRFGGEAICSNPQLRTDMLEAAVWEEVCTVLAEPERIAQEYQRRLEQPEVVEAAGAETQLNRVRQGMARLIDSYADGLIDKGEFEPRLMRLRERGARLEVHVRELHAVAARHRELRLLIGRLETFATQVHDGLATADWAKRRETIRALVKRVEVGLDEINVVFGVAIDPDDSHTDSSSWQHCGDGEFTGTLHRDVGDLQAEQPGCQGEQIGGQGAKGSRVARHTTIRVSDAGVSNHALLMDIEPSAMGMQEIDRVPVCSR
jgi:site-specific DNA recombinase